MSVTSPNSFAQWVADPSGAWRSISASGAPLTEAWEPVTVSARADTVARIRPSAVASQIPGGLRVVYTYTNASSSIAELASLRMPVATIGSSATVQDLREIGSNLTVSASGGGWSGAYPQVLYCPAAIVRGGEFALGVSVEYPVLTYRHEVRLSVRPQGDSQWWIEVGFDNGGLTGGITWLFNKPVLAPGETRQYAVNIVMSPTDSWIETLAPYRDFFKATYGDVRYVRDGRPIAGISLAYGEFQVPSNPDGWIPETNRPDQNGFSRASAFIESQFAHSDRVMVWAPTGLSYPQSRNFPFQFASRWTSSSGPMQDAPQRLSAVAAQNGRSLGLWWGHSASPISSWRGGVDVPIDAPDGAGTALCEAELRAARSAGATTIGLDAFAHCIVPVWKLVPHLAAMKAAYPELQFCSEGRAPDVLHALSSTWIDGYRYPRATDRDEFVAIDRFRVADYLLPGHETWVGMSFDRSTNPALWGPTSSQSSREALIRDTIARGFVPIVWTGSDLRALYDEVSLRSASR